MGLIEYNRPGERLRKRVHVLHWRVRYWWMDTRSGSDARLALLCASLLVAVGQFALLAVEASSPPAPGEPVRALYWWVVQLIVAIVSAIISYALRPKPQGANPSQQEAPTVEDGQATLEVHGDVWIDDEFILAQQVVGKVPIKSGGKK